LGAETHATEAETSAGYATRLDRILGTSAATDEQDDLRDELNSHSERFMAAADDLESLEEQPDPPAEEAAEKAKELANIAKAQEAIGDEIETGDVSLEDLSNSR
jgi:hypothetical protein